MVLARTYGHPGFWIDFQSVDFVQRYRLFVTVRCDEGYWRRVNAFVEQVVGKFPYQAGEVFPGLRIEEAVIDVDVLEFCPDVSGSEWTGPRMGSQRIRFVGQWARTQGRP